MVLKVEKRFEGIVENRVLNPGETIITDDLARINAMVGGGYCKIEAIENPKGKGSKGKDSKGDEPKDEAPKGNEPKEN